MKGYVRSICYWAYCMESLFLGMLGTMLMISVIFAFMDTEGMNWYRWMTNYIPMLGFIFPVAGGMNLSNMQVPMALSSGSTRKESACGVIIMSHMIMLQLWILAVICNSLLPTVHEAEDYLKVCGMLFVVSCGLGNGLGALILRFGHKVGMVTYIVMLLLFVTSAGIISASYGINAVLPFISNTGAFVVGVIFDIVMAIAFYLGIRKYEVRI